MNKQSKILIRQSSRSYWIGIDSHPFDCSMRAGKQPSGKSQNIHNLMLMNNLFKQIRIFPANILAKHGTFFP